MKTEARQELNKRAERLITCKAGELMPKALNMFDKAINDGDEDPKVKMVIDITFSKSFGEYVVTAGDGKAERKMVEKGEALEESFDPNQPDLFKVEGGE